MLFGYLTRRASDICPWGCPTCFDTGVNRPRQRVDHGGGDDDRGDWDDEDDDEDDDEERDEGEKTDSSDVPVQQSSVLQ